MEGVSFVAAFSAGIISFLSPCVLPLVPGYISLISGVSRDEMVAGDNPAVLRKVLIHSIFFIIGFSLVFIALGASASTIGQMLVAYKVLLYRIGGLIIIVFGLHMTGLLKIAALYQDKRFHNAGKGTSPWGALVIGMAFAFGWTPCLGPILGAILTVAASQETVSSGILLLGVYSLGLGIPFLMTSLGVNRFLRFYARFRSHMHKMEVGAGVIMIILGFMI